MENTEERSMLLLEFVKLVTALANLVSVVIKLISEFKHSELPMTKVTSVSLQNHKSSHPDQG